MRGAPEDARRRSRRSISTSVLYAVLALAIAFYVVDITREAAPRRVSYSELLAAIDRNEVAEVRIADRELIATLVRPSRAEPLRIAATRLPGIDESQFITRLEQHNVKFSGIARARSPWLYPIGAFALLLLIAAMWTRGPAATVARRGLRPWVTMNRLNHAPRAKERSWPKARISAKRRRSRSRPRRSSRRTAVRRPS